MRPQRVTPLLGVGVTWLALIVLASFRFSPLLQTYIGWLVFSICIIHLLKTWAIQYVSHVKR